MKDLIEALQIFLKYGNPQWPTHCSHDQLTIMEIKPSEVSEADRTRLQELGFEAGSPWGEECFYSYRFGSA